MSEDGLETRNLLEEIESLLSETKTEYTLGGVPYQVPEISPDIRVIVLAILAASPQRTLRMKRKAE